MKTVCKKLLCLMLVAMMLVSAVPFAFATEGETALFWIEVRVNGESKDSKQVTMPVNPDGGTVLAYAKLDDVWGSYFTKYADHEVKIEELAPTSAAVNFVTEENKPDDGNNRPGQDNNRPGQDNNRPGQDNNRPGQDNNRPGQDNNRPERGETYSVTVKFKNGATKEKVVEVKLTDDEAEDLNVAGAKKLLKNTEYANDIVGVDVNERTNVITVRVNKNADDYRHNDHDKDHGKDDHDKNDHDKKDHKVTLRVYTNGDTRHADRVFDMDNYAGDGKITRKEVENLLNKKYNAKNGHTLAYFGLFTERTWDDGRYDIDDAVSSVKVSERGETVVYVMIKNVKKAVADSSNPKTGDNIMIAATTMALTAAALVSIVELKKRKMI